MRDRSLRRRGMRVIGRTLSQFALAMGLVFLPCASGTAADDGYHSAMTFAVAAKEKALDTNLPEDWREALLRFRLAGAIQNTAASQYEIGFAASQLGEAGLAVETYSIAIELGLTGTAGEKARAYVVTHSGQMARLVITGEAGIRIIIRGLERGHLPLARPIVVEPETSEVEFVSAEGIVTSQGVQLEPGRIGTLSVVAPDSPPSNADAQSDTTRRTGLDESSAPNIRRPPRTAPMSIGWGYASNRTQRDALHKRSGLVLLSAGTSLGALSIVSLIVSAHKVSESRRDLLDRCAEQTNGPDTCAHTKIGQWDSAQSASDAIATWKAVRTGSWLGLSLGIASVIGGAAWLHTTNSDTANSERLPSILVAPHDCRFSYQGTF
jgi:hypothetical protein